MKLNFKTIRQLIFGDSYCVRKVNFFIYSFRSVDIIWGNLWFIERNLHCACTCVCLYVILQRLRITYSDLINSILLDIHNYVHAEVKYSLQYLLCNILGLSTFTRASFKWKNN